MLSQNDLQPAYALLKQLKHTTEKHLEKLYQHVFSNGRAVYETALKGDDQLWNDLGNQWGKGSGYKIRISGDSKDWFIGNHYPNYEKTVTSKAVDGWNMYVTEIRQLLGAF
jgi:hypothetical protein